VTAWTGLHSPVTGLALHADTPHSLSDGRQRWPIVDDIPFLRADRIDLAEQALAALDAGDAFQAAVLLLSDQDRWARTKPPSEDARRSLVRQQGAVSFRAAMDLLAYGPVGTYFAHRWSDPTFLSGLALAEAHRAPGSIFELACGAGHFLREFGRTHTVVAGGDVVFSKLWLARHYLAPRARLVCFDAADGWPFANAAFDTVFCHDAFYFLPDKPHVAAEMRRVAAGPVLVGHAHNALVDNLSAGSPMAPAGYAALFGTPLLYDDRELTAALVEARAPVPIDVAALAAAPAVAMAAGAGAPRAVTAGVAMPRDGTLLRRNPLYEWTRVRWPSERYEREYGALATYPIEAIGPETAVAGDVAVEPLVRRRVLLDLPERW
jgi:SAM-dependent methyltransferase